MRWGGREGGKVEERGGEGESKRTRQLEPVLQEVKNLCAGKSKGWAKEEGNDIELEGWKRKERKEKRQFHDQLPEFIDPRFRENKPKTLSH